MADVAAGSRPAKEQENQGAHFQDSERSRRREFLVVAIKTARLAERGMLHPENPATTQGGQGSGNIGGHARFEALRRAGPCGPMPTAPEALGGVGGAGWGVAARS